MAEYYDIDKPFSIDNWNQLLTDVNEILQHPPEGTDCEPVDPIELVEDPHKWSIEDIEEVRNKLIETCPEIEFQTELVKWKSEIIDEIESQMEQAWCNCEGMLVPEILPIDDYHKEGSEIEGAPFESVCCGNIEYNMVSVLCPPPASETIWLSPYYPSTEESNWSIRDQAYEYARTAANATGRFRETWNDLMSLAEEIEEKQEIVDEFVAAVDSKIAAYEACVSETGDATFCAYLKTYICIYGEIAKQKQEELNEKVSEYQSKQPTLATDKLEADTAAQQDVVLLLSMSPRYPTDENIGSLIYSKFVNIAWEQLIYPKKGGRIRSVETIYCDSERIIPITRIYWGVDSPMYRISTGVTPGGYPYSRDYNMDIKLVTETTNTYYTKTMKWRAEGWEVGECVVYYDGGEDHFEMQACEWCPYNDYYCRYLEGIGFQGCYHPWEHIPVYGNPYSLRGNIYKHPSTKDYSDKQEEFHDKYMNWYDEHPQYDNRHEEYC